MNPLELDPNRRESLDKFVRVRGASKNNLRAIDVDIPRNALVFFTGVSGSGKSSLAFGTIFAEAQRRYFESIAPYARRLLAQMPAPRVEEITGLPPAVALEQRRGEGARSTVGTLTTLANILRMLFSRAGSYPYGGERLDSDSFSPNTPAGACSVCHGIGIVHDVEENTLVPDASLSIREGAIAAWPGAWQGKNYRDILATLGYDVDRPWRELAAADRQWILFTDEKPVVTVHAQREAHRIQRPYQGTYMSAAAYVRHTFGTTGSAVLRKRVERFMTRSLCTGCGGRRLKAESLAVTFGGLDITAMSRLPLSRLREVLLTADELKQNESCVDNCSGGAGIRANTAQTIVDDFVRRLSAYADLGLDYLALDRAVPTLSAGELQRLRLATQLRSGLFGVVYVLDEPSAGLHPADGEALFAMLLRLKDEGNSLFVVEHDMDLVRRADWIVDIGPGAGSQGGELIYSGQPEQMLEAMAANPSPTAQALFNRGCEPSRRRLPRGEILLTGVNKHNLSNLDVSFPLAVLTAVTGISGSGKSTLVSQVLRDCLAAHLAPSPQPGKKSKEAEVDDLSSDSDSDSGLRSGHGLYFDNEPASPDEEGAAGLEIVDGEIHRLVCVDQKPIGRTPRSNLATYTGLFDAVRKAFAATPEARRLGWNAGRFSFNVAGGRCSVCEGEGFVSVELMFLPSVYSPCTACGGSRYNSETLQITYRDMNIGEVLELTVDEALEKLADITQVKRALTALQQIGLGYLKLGQPATELSGGEAQRIKLATELQREEPGTVYLLDEPTTGLHPADSKVLLSQLNRLVDAGNSVIVVEHDMDIVSAADWVIDLGPGAGVAGGKVVACGAPQVVASGPGRTAAYLAARLALR